MTHATALKRRLDKAAAVVASARRTLAGGDLVDLAGLDSEVDEICREINELAPEQGHSLRSALITLADGLDLLGQDLRATHEKVAAEIEDTSARQQAAKAYARGQTTDK
jgi:hypothetical protein